MRGGQPDKEWIKFFPETQSRREGKKQGGNGRRSQFKGRPYPPREVLSQGPGSRGGGSGRG